MAAWGDSLKAAKTSRTLEFGSVGLLAGLAADDRDAAEGWGDWAFVDDPRADIGAGLTRPAGLAVRGEAS